MKKILVRLLAAFGLSQRARETYNRLKLLLDKDLMEKNRSSYKNPPDGLPLPPLDLIYLVIGRFDAELFYTSGLGTLSHLKKTFEEGGADLGSVDRVLDFGCGCGRSIRHLKGLGIELHGSDCNPALVRWCAANLPFAEFRVNGLAGRTGYEDSMFGLVYAKSVFTHFDEELQITWMAEMARIIRPGGFLLATTHGGNYLDHFTDKERADYLSGSLVVIRSADKGSNECAAYHPRQYMEKLVSGLFVPAAHLQGKGTQDTWLLKRL